MLVVYLRRTAQGFRSHFRITVIGPSHCLPPQDGGGLVQFLVNDLQPEPQVTEQCPSDVYSLQPPSTIKIHNVYITVP